MHFFVSPLKRKLKMILRLNHSGERPAYPKVAVWVAVVIQYYKFNAVS